MPQAVVEGSILRVQGTLLKKVRMDAAVCLNKLIKTRGDLPDPAVRLRELSTQLILVDVG